MLLFYSILHIPAFLSIILLYNYIIFRSVVPCEVLITGSAVIFSIFGVELSGPLVYEPLFHTSISQPHTFFCRNTDNVFTCQVKLFCNILTFLFELLVSSYFKAKLHSGTTCIQCFFIPILNAIILLL